MIKFGVAGNSISFYEEGNTTTLEAGAWCAKRGIDVFEYSFGRGVTISSATATAIGEEFKKNGVELTVHAPYFTNFSNPDDDMIKKSIGYVLSSAKKVKDFGGNRVVIHPACQGKASREAAHSRALVTLSLLRDEMLEAKLDDVIVCIETMGTAGQMGTVEEVIDYCSLASFFYPCIDFGHVNAREQGILKSAENYNTLIQKLLDFLDFYKIINMHSHFSKIEYGIKGERRHLTFSDTKYGPEFPPLAEVLVKRGLEPYVICESAGTQAEDAAYMKAIYNSLI